MAQLDVQPKKQSSAWLLIIFIILAAGAAVLLYKGCNKSSPLKADQSDTTKTDTTKLDSNAIATTPPDWNSIDFNIPKYNYDEVTDTAIVVKANDRYTIYSLGEDVLFKKGESKIMPSSEATLREVSKSILKRYKDANVGVYSHIDSTGGAAADKSLSAARTLAVKDWLTKVGRLPEDQISIHSVGEQQPLGTDGANKGGVLNRSVEIVAFPGKALQ
ncbi:OmpA family protein [Mucilaginibacter sp. 21P]|uniref:OmpA family protein n=1 Tax=Mucilaginibacter sp. 21P TaxID=2778902 RepID=UPI001C57B6FC|nr:OmpA family protein [Mucilaginibacter sp. 21P]QXV64541.1 OmpA family protein [Mucilaginibacter sp. 21P]